MKKTLSAEWIDFPEGLESGWHHFCIERDEPGGSFAFIDGKLHSVRVDGVSTNLIEFGNNWRRVGKILKENPRADIETLRTLYGENNGDTKKD